MAENIIRSVIQFIKKSISILVYAVILLCFPTKRNKPVLQSANLSIIIIFFAGLGDMVVFCDVARKLNEAGKQITLVCPVNRGIIEFASSTSYFNRIVPLKTTWLMRIVNLFTLSQLKADIALTVPVNRHPLTDIYTLATGAKVKIAAATTQGMVSNILLEMANLRFEKIIPVHAVNELERYNQYMSGASLLDSKFKVFRHEIAFPVSHQNLVAFFPGAAGSMSKCWPIDRFSQTAQAIHMKYQCTVVILGTATELTLAEQLVESLGKPWWINNLCGKTSVMQTMNIISGCRAVLSNDSGGAHLGISVDVPTIILAGQWEWGRFYPNPYLSEKHKVVYNNSQILGCRNCKKSRPDCSKNVAAQCILNITVNSVLQQLDKVLAA